MTHSELRPLLGLLAAPLLLGLLFLVPRPASAGTWLMHVALTPGVQNNGIAKASPKPSQTWTQPTDATNSITVGSIARGAGSSTSSVTATTVLSVTLTATWTTADSTNDPAPTSVKVLESATAYANYTQSGANGGAGTSTVGTVDDGPGQGDTPNANGSVSGTKYVTCPVQGGSFTLALAPTASASTSPGPSGTDSSTGLSYIGTCTASAGIGPLSFAIHAQPYNFRRVYAPSVTPSTSVIVTAGELQFYYKWSSTSGVMSGLSGETIHENVDAPSSPSVTINGVTQYAPPPPFGWGVPFHFDSVAVDASSVDGISDTHSWGNGQAPITDAFAKPYQANSFNLTQNYKFYDPATMQAGTEQQIPGNSGPFTITDAVITDPTSASGYSFTVTKDGSTSLPQPLP